MNKYQQTTFLPLYANHPVGTTTVAVKGGKPNPERTTSRTRISSSRGNEEDETEVQERPAKNPRFREPEAEAEVEGDEQNATTSEHPSTDSTTNVANNSDVPIAPDNDGDMNVK